MTELEAYKALVKAAFSLEINFNDCFIWGCADSSKIDGDDVEVIIPLYMKYGFEALMAYYSINEGFDGDEQHIKKYSDWDSFIAAKAELRPLVDKGEIMYERYSRLKQQAADIKDFGHIVQWGMKEKSKDLSGFVPIARTKRFIRKANHYFQVARIPGLLAIGGSQFETRKRLLEKFHRIHKRRFIKEKLSL